MIALSFWPPRLPLPRLCAVAVLGMAALLPGCAHWRGAPPVAGFAPPPALDQFVIQPDTEVIGQSWRVMVQGEESLLDLARRYDLGYDELVAANPTVDPWVPGAGTEVLLPGAHVLPDAPRRGLVINLPARRLFYYPPPDADGGQRVITHPVGIGREGWGTPLGATHVAAKTAQPAWTVPASIRREHAALGKPLPAVVPPGPENPLGSHALRLARAGYLIHGTNKPYGIGMRVSHGCIQLYPEDIRSLFDQVPVGTPVHIVDQPLLAGVGPQGLVLEAHAPLDRKKPAAASALSAVLDAAQARSVQAGAADPELARRVADTHDGVPWSVAMGAAPPELGRLALPLAPPNLGRPLPVQAAGQGDWWVDLGLFRYPNNARRLVGMVTHLGPPLPAQRVPEADQFRVLAGPFATQRKADAAARRIGAELGVDGSVRRQPQDTQARAAR